MADNTTLNSGTGGDTVRTLEDGSSIKWPAGVTAFATTVGTPDVLSIVTPTAGLPVRLADASGYLSALPITDNGGSLTVDGTVAVTGTFFQATQPVSIAATVTVTGAGGTFPVTDSGGSLTVDSPVGTPVFVRLSDGAAAITTLPVSVATVPSHDVTNAGTFAVQAAQSGAWNVTNVSGTVSLPTGAATAARQDTGNTSLASLDGKAPALGQALAAASVPVVLTAAQITTLTPPAAITGFATESTLSTLNSKVTAVNTGAVVVSSSALPTGAATAAKQPALGTAGTASADVLTVQGVASMTALKVDGSAVTQPVSGTFFQATQPVSIAATVTVTGAGGSFPVTDSGGSLTVDNAGTFAVQAAITAASGSIAAGAVAAGATSFVKLEDVASADADAGVPSMAVRKATPANTSGTDGDYEFLQMSAGRLWTSATIDAALPAGTNAIGKLASNTGVTIGAVELAAAQTLATVTTVGTVTTCSTVTTLSTLTGGGVAHDGADSGNPHKIGAKAKSGLSGLTLVADADRTDLFADLDGVFLSREDAPLADTVSGQAAITDGSSTSVIAAQGAGIRMYVTDVTIANSSATFVTVDLRDGTAGSVKWTFPVPATGGVTYRFKRPLIFTANTAIAADPSAAASTVTVSISGFKSKV